MVCRIGSPHLLLSLKISKIEKRFRLASPSDFAHDDHRLVCSVAASRREQNTEPTSVKHAALIENGRAIDADSMQ